MPDEAPGFDAAEVRVPFTPDTSAMDEFWDSMEQRRDRFVEETRRQFEELGEAIGQGGGVVQGGGGSAEAEISSSELSEEVRVIRDRLETEVILTLGAILEQLQNANEGVIGG